MPDSIKKGKYCFLILSILVFLTILFLGPSLSNAQGRKGYYRFPAIHDDLVVFVSEGDLWAVSLKGGLAHRLTTNYGEESHPAISPNGKTLAFSAQYEGPTEVYTMPLDTLWPNNLRHAQIFDST